MTSGKVSKSGQSASDTLTEAVQIVLGSLPTLQAALSELYEIRRKEVTSTNQGPVRPYQEKTYLSVLTFANCELKVFITLAYRGMIEDAQFGLLATGVKEEGSEVAAAIASLRLAGLVYRTTNGPMGQYRLTAYGEQVYDQVSEDGYDPNLPLWNSI